MDIFRSIFGLPKRETPRSSPPDDWPFRHQRDPRDDLINDDPDGTWPHGGGGYQSPDDIFRQFDEMFSMFDRAFKGFGSFDNGPSIEIIVPGLSPPGAAPPDHHQLTPRDKMLKQPDGRDQHEHVPNDESIVPNRPPGGFFGHWNNPAWDQRMQPREDADLDDVVRSGGLDAILGDDHNQQMIPAVPRPGASFQTISVQTRHFADGKVEERRTMVDGNGNEQTVVSRSVDGQTIRQTMKRNSNGEQEVTEDLVNLDEKQKDSFEEKWKTPRSFFRRTDITPRNEVLPSADPGNDATIFKRIFGYDFPGSGKYT